MSEPTVTAIMLTCDRPEMTARAVASFEAQTYPRKRLVIYDASQNALTRYGEHFQRYDLGVKRTIGALRNLANKYADSDLIAHWDSDDWSHRQRLAEQVALLQASGKQLVGYRELLFWDTRHFNRHVAGEWQTPAPGCENLGEAWIYRHKQANWAAGASFLYTRALWEQQSFPDAPHEDQRWWLTPLVSRACVGMSAIVRQGLVNGETTDLGTPPQLKPGGPRMVCGIHGGNTEPYDRGSMLRGSDVWRQAPEWDEYCGKVMAL